MIARLKTWLAVAGAVVLAVVAALFMGQRRGRQAERADHDRRNLDAMKDAKDVRDEIDRESPDDVRRRLDGWMRDE